MIMIALHIASFIRTADNVRSVIAYLNRCITELKCEDSTKPYTRPSVISKIENKEGLDNFDEILKASDGKTCLKTSFSHHVNQCPHQRMRRKRYYGEFKASEAFLSSKSFHSS